MKKVLTIALTLVLALSLAVPAFADDYTPEITANNGTTTKVVTGTYVGRTYSAEVISVDVVWDTMSFTYTDAKQGTWNPATHNYDSSAAAAWTNAGNTITVTNHSNVAVDATLSFAKTETLEITGSFTETSGTANDNSLELASAVGTDFDEAPSATATFNVTGKITASGNLGTITVTVAKVANPS